MKAFFSRQFVLSHVLLVALVLVIVLVPNQKLLYTDAGPLLMALVVMEVSFLLLYANRIRKGRRSTGPCDIIMLIWVLMIGWELSVPKFAIMPPVLFPAPEEVFDIFRTSYDTLANNVVSSVTLLLAGFFAGIIPAVVLGIVCGWIPRLREMFYPIANVLAPIPPTVFAPYLVVLMPSFRVASMCVILLGVFWPQFLNMVLRVSSLDRQLLDNARALGVRNVTMITKIILPYVFPGVLKGLRVNMTTAFLMLTFAEMIGATAGIGFYISNSNVYANYAACIAGIIVCGIVVTALSFCTSWLERRFTKWR